MKKFFGSNHCVYDFSLKDLSTFKVGGKGKIICFPENLSNAINVYKKAKKEFPVLILGKGSNILFSDNGYDGVIISTKNLNSIRLINETFIYFEAGVTVSELLSFCVKNGLTGLEFLAGIPASLGGLVLSNAGAFNNSFLEKVEYLGVFSQDKLKKVIPKSVGFSYRKSCVNSGEFALFGGIKLEKADSLTVKTKILEYLNKRNNQPKGFSAGSVFKNPKGDFAGRLIEEAGLKGKVIGKAKISEKHANFIINTGGALAQDIYLLIRLAEEKVYEKFNIKLEREIILVGEF
jgi:UDP-N-acetylmuramate dehydrogenase